MHFQWYIYCVHDNNQIALDGIHWDRKNVEYQTLYVLGYVGLYSSTGGNWTLQQALYGIGGSQFGYAVAFSPSGQQLCVGGPYYNSYTGMW